MAPGILGGSSESEGSLFTRVLRLWSGRFRLAGFLELGEEVAWAAPEPAWPPPGRAGWKAMTTASAALPTGPATWTL